MKTILNLTVATLSIAAMTPFSFAEGHENDSGADARSRRADELLFASAALGPTSQPAGGVIINLDQYIGVRFEVHSETKITGVGGHIGTENDLSANVFYATIVRLPNASALPAGNPLDDSEVVASVLCSPNSSVSQDYVFPMKTKLSPGHYALVFGGGGTNAHMVENNQPLPDTSFIAWDLGTGWSDAPTLDHVRFTLYGSAK